jgi:hypothetical protein
MHTHLKLICLINLVLCLAAFNTQAQDDLLHLLEEQDEEVQYIKASFKTNRIINLHSLESTPFGVLDFKISHRFGFVNTGIQEFFGLDNATIRLGLDYGITDNITIGIGRSSYEKTYDGFLKYKLLRQRTGKKNTPVTAAFLASVAVRTNESSDPNIDYSFTDRTAFAYQFIVGRKFNENFSLEVVPSMIHRNLVQTNNEENDVFAIGFGSRYKLSKRISLNLEYIYVLPDQLAEVYHNSFSVGFDIETGGHVFQLHFTNSTPMIEKGFIAETVGKWGKGDIHFGFNVSRVFTIVQPKAFR